jgi:hypothetical protein
MQRIATTLEIPLAVVDLDEGEIGQYVSHEVERPFALDRVPLFRISVIRSRTGGTTLLIVMHHIICDEWSLGVLLREFSDGYRACRAGRPLPSAAPLPLQLADYAEWEASPQAQANWEVHRRYWAAQLRGVSPVPLPGAPAIGLGVPRGGYLAFQIERPLIDQVQRLAVATRATLSMVLLATFDALLHGYTGENDIAVGTPVAGRRRETEPLIGFFVNQLVMRVDLRGNPTFIDLVGRVRDVALAAYAHQEFPFDEIVATIRTKQTQPMMPLVNVQFDAHNAPFGTLQIDDLSLTPRPIARRTVQFDLQLSVEETSDGLDCFLGYNSDRISESWARCFADDFTGILREATATPSRAIGDLPLAGLRRVAPSGRTTEADFAF